MLARFQPQQIAAQPLDLPISQLIIFDEYMQPLFVISQTSAGILLSKRGDKEFSQMVQNLGLEKRKVITSEMRI